MDEKYQRIKNNIINFSSRFLKNYKYYLLVFFILFLIGFLTGIITASDYSKDLTCENLINIYMYSFLKREMTFFSYFLTMALYFAILLLFTTLLVRNKFMIVINTIILVLIAYIFGFDLCILMICLGLAGVILGALFIGLLGIVCFGVYILILSIQAKKVLYKMHCEEEKLYFLKCYLILSAIWLIIMLVSIMLFSIIHIFVIVEWFVRFILKNVVNYKKVHMM